MKLNSHDQNAPGNMAPPQQEIGNVIDFIVCAAGSSGSAVARRWQTMETQVSCCSKQAGTMQSRSLQTSVWSRPTSRPTISERRRPPAKPTSSMTWSRRLPDRAFPTWRSDLPAALPPSVVEGRRLAFYNAGHDGRDTPVFRVQWLAVLCKIPRQAGEAPLDRRV